VENKRADIINAGKLRQKNIVFNKAIKVGKAEPPRHTSCATPPPERNLVTRWFKVPLIADNSPPVEGWTRSGRGGSAFPILIALLKLTFFRFNLPALG
jgi:hypothetical protein